MSDPIHAETTDMSERVAVDAVELKTIEVRLDGVKEATHRSRFVFIIMTIVASTILISLWNSMLAWDRGMALPEERVAENPVIRENQKTVASEWLKNLNVSVGLLGIRVGTYDLAVIGSSSLIVIMVWFFFSQRRENRAIVGLLRYCSEGFKKNRLSKEVCNLAYEGIVQSIVFIDMGGGDKPIEGLIADKSNADPNLFIRTILKGLVFLPPITILMIIIVDMSSLFIRSAERDSDEALWRIMLDGHHNGAVAKIVGFELFAILACRYTWLLCRKCREFSKATSLTIIKYKKAGLAGESELDENSKPNNSSQVSGGIAPLSTSLIRRVLRAITRAT